MSNGWRKILILAGFDVVLIAVVLLASFWPSQQPQSLSLIDDKALFPVVLGPNKIINSPPPAFYQEKSLYKFQTKGLGFGTAGNSYVPKAAKTVLPSISADLAKGIAETFSKSTLPAAIPAGFKSKLAVRDEIFVFPKFYVDYLNEMQNIMAADGAIKQKRMFKTNDDVVLFLDDFYDYLIAEGIVPKSEESRLHSGIRKALELLKDEATRPQSYFNFPSVKKLTINQKSLSDYGFKIFLDNFTLAIQPLKTAQAQTEVLGFKITPEMGQKAGKFVGGKLGDTIGGKLGKFIPSGIAGQIGSFVGSKVGTKLGSALGSLFRSGPSAIDSQLRLQIAAEFGNTGTLADAFTSQELQSLYGPSLGSEIDEMFRAEMGAEFGVIAESSFFGDLTKGLQDLLGSDFGKMIGDLFGKFNDLSSIFSGFGGLGSLLGLGGGQDCYRESLGPRENRFVQNFYPRETYRDEDFLYTTISLFDYFIKVRPVFAQTSGSPITPKMGTQAGQFIGKQLGGMISGKLGKFIPGGIANQLGNVVGSQLGSQLGNSLSSLFQSGPNQIDQALRLQMEAEFGRTGTLADALTSQELQSLYGPTMGAEIDSLFSSEMAAEFGVPAESSFFSQLTGGLFGELGEFGKMIGDLFGRFNDLSSAFSSLSSLANIPGLGLLGGGGGSNLPAPCCDCTTGGEEADEVEEDPQPIGCLNKVCPSGPAIWDPQTKICGCGKGGGSGAGAGIIGGIPGLGGAGNPISNLGLDKALGGVFKNAAGFFGLDAISPQLANMAGKFVAGQLGSLVSNQLGKLIPGGIANQIGGFIGNQLGSQLGQGLSGIFSSFDSGAMSPADARTAIDAEFGEIGSAVDSQLREQLGAEYGPIQGDYLYDQYNGEFSTTFTSDIEASFIDGAEIGVNNAIYSDLVAAAPNDGQIITDGSLTKPEDSGYSFIKDPASNVSVQDSFSVVKQKQFIDFTNQAKENLGSKYNNIEVVYLDDATYKQVTAAMVKTVIPNASQDEIKEFADNSDAIFAVDELGSRVYVNGDYIGGANPNIVDDTSNGAITHEIGHAAAWEKAGNDPQFLKGWTDVWAPNNIPVSVSNYGYKSPTEGFAETFVAYNKYGGDASKIPGLIPAKQSLIQKQFDFMKAKGF